MSADLHGLLLNTQLLHSNSVAQVLSKAMTQLVFAFQSFVVFILVLDKSNTKFPPYVI